ncbi:MAG: hypothetical protein PUP93_17910 [Rhizonema sp. NSF051]|nr:hypothetical protein [Rhizonema sp. NSF051]
MYTWLLITGAWLAKSQNRPKLLTSHRSISTNTRVKFVLTEDKASSLKGFEWLATHFVQGVGQRLVIFYIAS